MVISTGAPGASSSLAKIFKKLRRGRKKKAKN